MAEMKRVNYFTYQFLVEKDFDDEQAYHVGMRRSHNRALHSWGVVEGLEVSASGAQEVTISPGMAIDREGREIVLPADPAASPVDLSTFDPETDVYLTIEYREVFDEADHYTSGGVDNYTRTTERPNLVAQSTAPSPSSTAILLARVPLDGSGIVGIPDNSVRKVAGIAPWSDIEARSLTLIDPNVVNAGWPRMRLGAANRADVEGSLRVSGHLNVEGTIQGNIAGGAVGAGQLADNAVTTPKLANGAVTNAKIADNAVNAAKIQDGSVGSAELANNAVTTAKLVDGAVTNEKVADNSLFVTRLRQVQLLDYEVSVAANATKTANVGSPDAFRLVSVNVTSGPRDLEWHFRSGARLIFMPFPPPGQFVNVPSTLVVLKNNAAEVVTVRVRAYVFAEPA